MAHCMSVKHMPLASWFDSNRSEIINDFKKNQKINVADNCGVFKPLKYFSHIYQNKEKKKYGHVGKFIKVFI